MAIVKVCSTNVKDFFENNLKNVFIPDFQRPFEWDEELIKQFLEDLIKTSSEKPEPVVIGNFIFYQGEFSEKQNNEQEGASRQNNECKLNFNELKKIFANQKEQSNQPEAQNSEICNTNDKSVNQNNNPKLAIIDGQQRLTVLLALWLKLDYEKTENNNQQNFFENCEILNKENENIKKINFKHIWFTYIITDDLDQAFLMFDTQNTRGVKLSDFDLIKAYHLNDVYIQNEEKAKEYAKFWEEKSKESFPSIFSQNKLYDLLIQIFYIRKNENLEKLHLMLNFENRDLFNEFRPKENKHTSTNEQNQDKKQEPISLIFDEMPKGEKFFEELQLIFKKYEILISVSPYKELLTNIKAGIGNTYLLRIATSLFLASMEIFKSYNFENDFYLKHALSKLYKLRHKYKRLQTNSVINSLKCNNNDRYNIGNIYEFYFDIYNKISDKAISFFKPNHSYPKFV